MPKPSSSTGKSMYGEELSEVDLDSVVGGLTTPHIKERSRIRHSGEESSLPAPADRPASGFSGPLGLRLPPLR